jgi:transcriptional regulator with XRE-family HTH domain
MKPLQEWRDERGYSIRDLAELSGVSKSTIENIERGHRYNTPDKQLEIQPSTMRKIAGILKVEIMEVSQFVQTIEQKRKKETAPRIAAIIS